MDDKFLVHLSTAYAEGASRSALLTELDDELDRARKRQCYMQECRNLLAAPICLLAPEILSHIFLLTVDNEDHTALFSLSWTSLLRVCRRWRDVCIDTPKLWSFVNIGHLPSDVNYPSHSAMIRRLNLQRERSKSYPLTVKLENLYIVTSSLLAPYASWLWRSDGLLSLSVHGASSCVADVLARLDSSEHPRLTHFDVRTCDFGDIMLAVSDDFLSDKLIHLRRLALSDALFSWHAVHSLRGLAIRFSDTFPVVYKLQDVIDAVARCPALEDLELNLQKTVTPLDAPSSPITLSAVKSVSIKGSLTTCLYLLHSMTFLAQTSVSVTVSSPSPEYDSDLFRALASRLKAHTRTPIRALAIYQNEHRDSLGLSGSLHPDLGAFEKAPHSRSMHAPAVHIAFPTDQNSALVLMDVLDAWSTKESLTHLDLRATQECPPTLWSGLFVLLPKLTTVAVSPEWPSASALLQVLRRESVDLSTPLSHIIFDAENLKPSSTLHRPARLASSLKIARANVLTLLEYCAQIRHEGQALGVFEIMNNEGDQLLGGLSNELLCRDADFIQNGRRSARLPPMVTVGLTASATRAYWAQFPLHLPLPLPAASYPSEL